jgi:hypothetical protein
MLCKKTNPTPRRAPRRYFGDAVANLDSLEATVTLMKWANQRRGFQYSQYRAQRGEFVVEIVDLVKMLIVRFRERKIFPSWDFQVSGKLPLRRQKQIARCSSNSICPAYT